MGRCFNGFSDLRDDGMEYAGLRWASIRLGVVDKLSGGLAKTFGYVIAFVLILLALAFMMFALALWIGEMLGHASLGFLIAGGGFLLLGVLMFFLGRALFANPLVRYFVDLFFTDKDNGYDTQD